MSGFVLVNGLVQGLLAFSMLTFSIPQQGKSYIRMIISLSTTLLGLAVRWFLVEEEGLWWKKLMRCFFWDLRTNAVTWILWAVLVAGALVVGQYWTLTAPTLDLLNTGISLVDFANNCLMLFGVAEALLA